MAESNIPDDINSVVGELLDACNNQSVQEAILGVVAGDENSMPAVEVTAVAWKEINPRVIPKPTAEQSKAVSEYLARQQNGV